MKAILWKYDVWGNAQDGYEVNDRFRIDSATLTAAPQTDADIKTILKGFNVDKSVVAKWEDDDRIELETRSGKPLGQIIIKPLYGTYGTRY